MEQLPSIIHTPAFDCKGAATKNCVDATLLCTTGSKNFRVDKAVVATGKRLQFQGVSVMIGLPSNDAGGLSPETQSSGMKSRGREKRN